MISASDPGHEDARRTTAIDQSRNQTMWGIARKRRKRTVRRGRSRSSVTTIRTGCSGSSEYGSASSGSEVGYRGVRRKRYAPACARVAERERGEVAQATRRAPAHEDREPGEERSRGCDAADRGGVQPERLLAASARRRRRRALARRAGREAAAERRREEERGHREEEPEEAAPATLTHGWVDLDVDRVVLLARGTTGTGSPRGTRTRRPASRSGCSSRRSRAGCPGPRPG